MRGVLQIGYNSRSAPYVVSIISLKLIKISYEIRLAEATSRGGTKQLTRSVDSVC